MYNDFHIHSAFSTDSQADINKIVNTAITKNMNYICITDHEDMNYNVHGDFEINLNEYYNSLWNIKKQYQNKINICIGIELGLNPNLNDELNNFVKQYPLDYVIGSVHLVNGFDPYYKEYWDRQTSYNGVLSYFKEVIECINNYTNFDSLGHLDYVVRYIKEFNFKYNPLDYIDVIDVILKKLIENNKGLELNTGGLYKGSKYTNPGIEILKRYKELGGEIITLGSDAHKPELIGYGFDIVKDLLNAADFKYYTIFEKRNAQFIEL